MTDIDILCSTSVGACSSRSQVNQQFTASSIEQMLRRKDSRKEFIVIENNRKKCSTAWSTFGFPARLNEDNTYEPLHGYASCFQCKTTYKVQSDGSCSTKHLLRHVCAKVPSTSEHHHDGPLNKLLK